ncbi:hypothetical protein Tco_0369483 [Tanacetum coccineum]
MSIRFAPTGWCRIEEVPRCSLRGARWYYYSPRGLVWSSLLRLLLKDQAAARKQQSDAFHKQMVAFQAELRATKGLIQVGRYGRGGEIASPIPRSMRLDVPNGSIITCDGFLESVRNRFGPKYEDPQGALSKLLQKGVVEQYQVEFEKLMHRVTHISAGLLITFYVSGLKPSVQHGLLVAKPTSLGDAFSLARVTKARLEDQGVTPPTSRSTVASGSQTMTKTTPRFTATRLKNPKPPLF